VREHGKGKERRVQDKKERGSKTTLQDKLCGTHRSKKKKVHFFFFNGAPR